MKQKEKWFAPPLAQPVRFLASLQLTALHFAGNKAFAPKILMYLLGLGEADLSDTQFRLLTYYKASPDRVQAFKEFFYEVYNDEQLLCDGLNKDISKRYFRKNRKKGETSVDALVRNIVNENLAELLDF